MKKKTKSRVNKDIKKKLIPAASRPAAPASIPHIIYEGPTNVILDTNFVMVPFLYKFDVLPEISRKIDSAHCLCVPSMVLTELAGIKGHQTKDAANAAASLKWLKKKIESHEIKLLLTTESVDKWILDFSSKRENKGKVIVCTNDVELRKSLKKKGVKVISLQGKNRLVVS